MKWGTRNNSSAVLLSHKKKTKNKGENKDTERKKKQVSIPSQFYQKVKISKPAAGMANAADNHVPVAFAPPKEAK